MIKTRTFVLLCSVILLSDGELTAQSRFPFGPEGSAGALQTDQATQGAEQAYQQGRHADCIRQCNSILGRNPTSHVAFYLRASARVEQGFSLGDSQMVRDGVADSRKAIEYAKPPQSMYYLPYLYGMTALSRMEQRESHAEVSLQIADQVLEHENSVEAKANLHYQKARAFDALRKPQDAIANYEQAISMNALHLAARTGLADTLEFVGQIDRALDVYGKTLERFPKEPLVHNNRGMLYQRRGEHSKAIADFSRAISLKRDFVAAWTNRGYSQLMAGNASAAEQDFSQSLRINASQPMVYSLRGLSRMMQDRIDTGLNDYEEHVRLAPSTADAWTELGFACSYCGKYDRAAEAFGRAMDLDPKRTFLAPWHYRALVSVGDSAAASERLESSLQGDDWGGRLLSYLAGQLDAAALLVQVNESPNTAKPARLCEAHYFIGVQELDSGNTAEAATHFRSAVRTGQAQLSAYRGSLVVLKKLDSVQQ